MKTADADRIRAYARANVEAAYKAAGAGEMALRGNDFLVRAHCHQPDDRPSLRISRIKGTFYCDPCGKGGDVFDYFAQTHGLNSQTDFPQVVAALVDLFHLGNDASPHANGRNGHAPWVPPDWSYGIRDAEGELIATHYRWEARDGKRKKLAWQRAGNKKFTLAGLPVADLPLAGSERARGWTEKTTVVVVEGEPAALGLLQRKIEAVGTVCGAGSTPRDESLMVLLAQVKWSCGAITTSTGANTCIESARVFSDLG